MGTAGLYSKVLHDETNFHGAWYPVANRWAVGDIGVVSDGVLVRTGNLADLGVNFTSSDTPPVSGVNFTSSGTKSVHFIGDAPVKALPDTDIDARLEVTFTKADSLFLKAAQLDIREMDKLDEVAQQVAQLKDRPWRRRYRFVHSTASATHLAFVSAREAGASFEIHGKANALKKLDLGKVELGLRLSSKSSLGLDFLGDYGVIGLRLFKLGAWRGGLRLLGPGSEALGIEEEPDDVLSDDI